MRNSLPTQKVNRWLKVILSGISIATVGTFWVTTGAIAQRNPNPTVFNEPPFNQGQRLTPATTPSPAPTTSPVRTPVSTIKPVDGKVTVKLINQTYTNVVYKELGGETAPRTLAGRSEVTLQNLSTPVNLNFYRPDRGFLVINLQPSADTENLLEVTMTETADQGLGKTSLNIEPDGNVYLY